MLLAVVSSIVLPLFRLLGASVAERGSRAVFLLAPTRGPLSWFFERSGMGAFTWGRVVTFRDRENLRDRILRRHELIHVEQQEKHGVLHISWTYLLDLKRAGYRGVRWEEDAYHRQLDASLPSDP